VEIRKDYKIKFVKFELSIYLRMFVALGFCDSEFCLRRTARRQTDTDEMQGHGARLHDLGLTASIPQLQLEDPPFHAYDPRT